MSRSQVLITVVAGVLVAMIALVAFLGYRVWEDNTSEQAREQAVRAASEQAVAILGYDHNTVETELPTAAEGLTGSFRDEYETLIREAIIPGALEQELSVDVSVAGTSIVSATKDTAVVLLFLNQVTTSSESPQAALTGSRVRAHMEKSGEQWLMAGLTPI
ncbi:hypothetical protein [Hoyosella subflava]|uniref:H domain protein n=1 Tax=Hoyosella subflava (strain DSM 45089 / JCM 17490 / NBRC 109087 / DQS3-9A1) TaxID=443218 RepID=F6EN26_HOYSD|nr:hypothetical protein [Hoyosella subflava]AEF39343.1 hypothetical protein AS9A_0891 [Hoyosella subflava DQS3-9A1]